MVRVTLKTIPRRLENIPQILRFAGRDLRTGVKLPEGLRQEFLLLMQQHGAAIRQPMLLALRKNHAPGLGRLLAEVLVKNQMNPSSCIKIIETAGKMMLVPAKRTLFAAEQFFVAAVPALKKAEVSSLIEYIDMAKAVSKSKEEKAYCENWIKVQEMDIDQAVGFIVEMDTIRAYEEQELASLLSMGARLFGNDFIGKFAAIRFYSVRQTAAMARDFAIYDGSKAVTDIAMGRGIESPARAALFFSHYFSDARRNFLDIANCLAKFCLRRRYDNKKIARLLIKFMATMKYTLNQQAVLISKIASLTNTSSLQGTYDLSQIGAFVKAVTDASNYSDPEKVELITLVARSRGIKGERRTSFFEIVTS